MSIEEKAKAYDEALKWMRDLYPELHGATKEDAEHYFPELRESEDERMVREFNDWLCEEIECRTNDLRDEKDRRTLNMLCYVLTKVKDWLERKKKPSVSLNPALGFDPGSAVVYHNDESKEETTRKELLDFVRSFWADHKEKLPQASRWVTYLEKQEEIPMPNSTELIEMWDKEEAMLKEKDFRGDTWRIAYNAFLDGFAQGMMVKQKEQKKDNPLEDFSKGYNAGYYHGRTDKEQKPELVQHPPITYTYPSDASRDEQLKMALLALLNSDLIKVAGNKFTKQDLIDWVEKQKEQKSAEKQDYSGLTDLERAIHRGFLVAGVENVPVKIIKETAQECLAQMKPAEWSEEDTLMLTAIIQTLERFGGRGTTGMQIDWLKSLRPQPQQEVTDEEIEEMVTKRARSSGTTKSEMAFYRNGIKDAIKRFGLRTKPKQEWSDKDECILKGIIGKIDHDQTYGVSKAEMLSFLEGLRPSWKPSEDEERLINTSISFLKDFADKGYENAVECIDWLKSKLNGNSCK